MLRSVGTRCALDALTLADTAQRPLPPRRSPPLSPQQCFQALDGHGRRHGGGGHANNPTFMFQARCGPRTPRQLRGARRIARRTAKNCAAPRATSPRPPSRRTPAALSRLPPPHPARCSSRRRTGTRTSGRAPSSCSPSLASAATSRTSARAAAAARCAAAAARPRRAASPPQPSLTDAPAPAPQGDGLCAEEGGRRVVDYVRQISVYSTQPKPHARGTRHAARDRTHADTHRERRESSEAPLGRSGHGRGAHPFFTCRARDTGVRTAPHSHAEVEDVRLGEGLLVALGRPPAVEQEIAGGQLVERRGDARRRRRAEVVEAAPRRRLAVDREAPRLVVRREAGAAAVAAAAEPRAAKDDRRGRVDGGGARTAARRRRLAAGGAACATPRCACRGRRRRPSSPAPSSSRRRRASRRR